MFFVFVFWTMFDICSSQSAEYGIFYEIIDVYNERIKCVINILDFHFECEDICSLV